ncbi:S49 family peptidase [Candidatus Endowatersipora endosymbiont of Watersipora subatra]|uniref:S49 family peptidase n=1 Tax=Candidatus Endowatersipora endosymbiont of Watersipora subatra TaxID=3077946 RepID=UPI00312C7EE2
MALFFKKILPKKLQKTTTTIPVVKLTGAIIANNSQLRPGLNLTSCAEQLQKAFERKNSPAVAIIINSPGGSPVQSRLIYQRIRDLSSEYNKIVHVFVEDVAASGGYMIACAGHDITSDPSSIVGSIGVISATFGFEEAIDKIGIRRRIYSAGKNKSMLDPFLPEKKQDIARLRKLQLEIHDIFINLVKESRGDRLIDTNNEQLFTGFFWTGLQGKDLGLVDAIGDIRGSIRSRYGETAKLKFIEPKKSLFGRRSMISMSGVLGIGSEKIIAQAADGFLSALEEKALWSRLGL